MHTAIVFIALLAFILLTATVDITIAAAGGLMLLFVLWLMAILFRDVVGKARPRHK